MLARSVYSAGNTDSKTYVKIAIEYAEWRWTATGDGLAMRHRKNLRNCQWVAVAAACYKHALGCRHWRNGAQMRHAIRHNALNA